MIVEAITLLLKQLNNHIAHADGSGTGAPNEALWGNVSQLDKPKVIGSLENRIVLTLVNIEEERALRNGKVFASTSGAEGVYRNRPVHLNLFLLFCATYEDYGTALKRLAQVIAFFQGKQHFTLANSPGAVPPEAALAEFSLAMDLLSPTFEEVNHLWGFLGAKQLPFALYRARLVAVSDDRVLAGGARMHDYEATSRDVTA